MTVTHTRTFRTAAATLALATATTVAAAPAHAAPTQNGTVSYAGPTSDSADGGSLDNQLVQAGLVIVAGIGVSAALAISAGLAGGAIPLPQIPGLPS